jgi:hypothetical protein
MDGMVGSVFQALLCLASIAAIRVAIIQMGPRIGAILMGTPMIMFPLLAMQAWQGPPVTRVQTIGSIAAMTALSGALWLYRMPLGFTPVTALLTFSLGWLAGVLLVYLAALPDWAMAGLLVLNGLFVLISYRNHGAAGAAIKARISDGAVVTTAFLIFFFLITRLIPDLLRGLLVAFPVGVLATIFFVRRILPMQGFRDFILDTQGAVTAATTFVLSVHYLLAHMPIALALAISLTASLGTTFIVGRIWRAASVAQPQPGS